MIVERSLWEWSRRLATEKGEAQADILGALAAAMVAGELSGRLALPDFPPDQWKKVLADLPYLIRCGLDPVGEPPGNVYEMVLRQTLIRSIDLKDWLSARDRSTQSVEADSGRGRRGPVPGAVDRYGEADRSLYPEIADLMSTAKMSLSAAAQKLADDDKIKGSGSKLSLARRLARRYKNDHPVKEVRSKLGPTHSH